MVVDRMMERWESLARKVEMLEKRLNDIEKSGKTNETSLPSFWELLERDLPDGPPDANRDVHRITKSDIDWLIKGLKLGTGKWWLDNETD